MALRQDNLDRQASGVAKAGNGYRGIGVPDCVRSGNEAANRAILTLGLPKIRSQVLTS